MTNMPFANFGSPGKHIDVVTELDPKVQTVHDLYVQYRTELCSYVVKSAGMSIAEAEDVVQSAFARYTELDMDAIENHRAFLYKACYNLAIDLKRKGIVRQRYERKPSQIAARLNLRS